MMGSWIFKTFWNECKYIQEKQKLLSVIKITRDSHVNKTNTHTHRSTNTKQDNYMLPSHCFVMHCKFTDLCYRFWLCTRIKNIHTKNTLISSAYRVSLWWKRPAVSEQRSRVYHQSGEKKGNLSQTSNLLLHAERNDIRRLWFKWLRATIWRSTADCRNYSVNKSISFYNYRLHQHNPNLEFALSKTQTYRLLYTRP